MKNSKANIRKLLILLVICIILIIVYEIIHIYAVFQSEVYGDISIEKGTWKIIINGADIAGGVDKTFTIDQIKTQDSQYVKEGKIAPGLTREF